MNAATQNTWTSYRDGRRAMHYMRADGGRYFVQKVEAGYAVTFLADEGDGVSIRLSTEATLATGKKWVADHLAAAPAKEHPTLADVVAKFEDQPMYECEIPGAPGRVTRGGVDITDEQRDTVARAPFLDAQKVGRVIRLPVVGATKIEHDRGQSFLANSARQLGVEYAFGAKDADPKTLEFKALRACAALQVISWGEAAPCGDMAVSQGLLTRWLPLCNPSAPSAAFPYGFVDTIYFPMRKGIRHIVIRRKSK